ncbi:MAG: alpha/beta hydrolase [Chloroflexi bacterium]|nr:alpha/beta hydrolase [Chloroflexota bacterium]
MPLDPRLFMPDAVSPEMTAFNTRLGAEISAAPPITEFDPAEVRGAEREGRPGKPPPVALDNACEMTCAGPAGEIPLRAFIPRECSGAYLHIHGGGWVLGGYDLQDAALWRMARETNLAVISVEYRLAPEHPYPAGPDDCEAAARWLVENSRSRFGTDSLLIGGESAGAHLSAVTVLRMRDRHGFTAWSGADFVYGAFDFSGACPSRTHIGADSLVINAANMPWFVGHFLGGREIDPADPDLSPLHAPLHGLPPALFSVGTADPLLDDSLFMYARWIAAGNPAEIQIYPGAAHAFDSRQSPLAERFHEQRHRFLRDCAGG